jgi:hypothetical protein
MLRFAILLSFIVSNSNWLFAQQQSQAVIVDKIVFEGLKKTGEKTALRELDFHVGDSIITTAMPTQFERNKDMLLNTELFASVSINVGKWDYEQRKVEIIIKVVENWYIFPFGWVSLADRNFNVWWKEKNRDLSRINYQIGINWRNVTGRLDRLKTSVEVGFGRKYEIDYHIPGINKKKTIGLFFNALYGNNKEVWYKTENDRLQFFNDEVNPQIKRFRIAGGFSFRPELRTIHNLQFSYFSNQVSAQVATLRNPDFFLNGREEQQYFSLVYKFSRDERRANKHYPQKGYFLSINAQKDGVFSKNEDVNAFYITTLLAKYFKIYKEKIDFETILKVRKELTGNPQPYYNTRALGYREDYLRGFEYYVIDGANYGYWKNSIRFKLLDINIDLGDFLPANIRYIPYKIWFTINNDLGYVKNPTSSNNALPNRLLWGRGVGFNVLAYRSNYYQLEFSQNDLGKFGFYFHSRVLLE